MTLSPRVLQPILLGAIANIIVNYIFNPDDPDFILSEFVAAILLFIPITEINHAIDRGLEKRFSWIKSLPKRLVSHLILLLLSIVFILNVVGNLYLWLRGDGFYTWQEYLIINSVAFVLSLLLTGVTWMSFYFKRWKLAEMHLTQSESNLDKIRSEIVLDQLITMSQGKTEIKVRPEEIKSATSKFGIVRISLDENKSGIFKGTLTDLLKLLPTYYYFLATRSNIIHRDSVRSVSSSSYGKIVVEIKDDQHSDYELIISRQKASTFRKWYNSDPSFFS
ncbi:MAG: LytTR family transcriptional regulator DNA-binding domain-containing protein [Cyclobacteriaceae bacterium]